MTRLIIRTTPLYDGLSLVTSRAVDKNDRISVKNDNLLTKNNKVIKFLTVCDKVLIRDLKTKISLRKLKVIEKHSKL